jgi:hypothetical protein
MQIKFFKAICMIVMILPTLCLAQTQLKSATMGTAGGKTESASFKMWSSIGQAVQPGTASSTNFHLYGNLTALTRDMELPSIIHTPPTSPQQAGTDIALQATATDNINVSTCTLLYRQGGVKTFTSSEMTEAEGVYTGTIPGTNVGANGVEYYIRAEDVNANIRDTDVYSVRVALDDNGITNSSAQPSGSAQSAYRLISLPLAATNKKPADVLEGVLGTYNNTKWRFFELESDQTYTEHPNTGDMDPGKAFWLIVKDADKTISTGAGNTVRTDANYSISLHDGWNLVGNPFNFSIPQANVTLQSGATLDIRSYNGNWNNFTGSLSPFQGYAVYTDAATSLLLNPDLSGVGKIKADKVVADKEGEWIIGIEAKCQDALDTDTRAVSIAKASEKYDSFDRPEPPVIGDFVSVYFPHPEWEKVSTKYCIDARPKLEEGGIWEFEIRTNIKENVSLSFTGVENVPAEFEIWFVDQTHKLLQNVRESATYEVSVSTKNPKKLMLAVGTAGFIEEKLSDYEMIPTSFSLDQNYPNPFNPTTTIRYGLPNDVNVSLKVYNLLGQEVTTLMNNVVKKAGYHTVVWDGLNRHGDMVASGMYIYHIQAGTFTSVKKMILVR